METRKKKQREQFTTSVEQAFIRLEQGINSNYSTLSVERLRQKFNEACMADQYDPSRTLSIMRYEEQFILSQDGRFVFQGNEMDCYYKLQREQGQSADWAFKYGGWKIEPEAEFESKNQI